MNRSHVDGLLSLYADGMLSADEADRVRTHLAVCEQCRSEWEALQHTLALLQALPEEEPPADLTASIMARVQSEAGSDPARRLARPRRWGAAAVAAAAAAAVLLVIAGALVDRLGPGDVQTRRGRPEQAVAEGPVAGLAFVQRSSGAAADTAVDTAPPPVPVDGAGMAGAAGDAVSAPGTLMAGAPGTEAPVVEMPGPAPPRRVIQNASLTLRVDDVESAYQQVTTLVETAGGYVQEASLSDDGFDIILPSREPQPAGARRVARLVLRVPVQQLPVFLDDVMALGKPGQPILHRIHTSDITDQYVDVEARLRNLQAKEARLLEITASAGNVEELLAVERELWQTRAEIESLQARLNTWNDLLELATVHLTLEPAGVAPPDRRHGLGERLLLAFYRGVDHLVVGIETMIVGAGVVLPWVVLAGVVWLIYRRRGRRRPTPPPNPHSSA